MHDQKFVRQNFHAVLPLFHAYAISLALMQSVMTEAMVAVVAPAFVATMSYSDSTAVFKKRFLEVGLTEANFESFNAEGLNTMGTFAFACNYAPGAADERPLITLATNILGVAPSTKEMACIRRLFSEAYSTIAADIRSKVEASDEAAVKKLAPAERSQRLHEQQQRLSGLEIRGNYEPGDSLIDRCVSAYESDRISYVSWDVCVSRDHEILTGAKRDSGLSFDASGHLKLTKKEQIEPCNTSNEMAVRYCLIRRGLALEQANIMGYKKHERLAEKLMNARMEEAPSGCVRLTLKQVEIADKKFWTLMAEKTREGIKAGSNGRPCDVHFDACFQSPEFLNLLQPRLAPAASAQPPSKPKIDEPRPKKPRPDPMGQKGASKGTFMRVPSELLSLGCVASTSKGHRLCFDYNLKRCKLPVKDTRCQKGLHLCAVKGCQKMHMAMDCPNKTAVSRE